MIFKFEKSKVSLVSKAGGSIQRHQVKMGRVLAIATVSFCALFSFVFVAGVDYGKGLSWVNDKFEDFSGRGSKGYRQLKFSKQALAKSRKELSTKEQELAHYKRSLTKHLNELSSILKKASTNGLLGSKDVNSLQLKYASFTDSADSLSTSLGVNKKFVRLLSSYTKTLKFMPLGKPVSYARTTSGFGYRTSPFGRSKQLHTGVDFAASYGTKVNATAYGRIKAVKRFSGYGLVVEIDHGGGVVSRYAHLSSALVKVGQNVIRGEVIGQIGMSGRSTGPHLHYEILVNGKAKNPSVLLEMFDKIQPDVTFASLPLG